MARGAQVSARRERLRLFEADYGREFGWFVERDGRRLAALVDPRFEEMFWYSYAVEPLATDAGERAAIFREEFWRQPGLVYRNRVTGEVAPNAFAGGAPTTMQNPRVLVRALHASLRPTILERALLWLRGRRRR